MVFYQRVQFLATNPPDRFHCFPFASVIASRGGVLGIACAEHKKPRREAGLSKGSAPCNGVFVCLGGCGLNQRVVVLTIKVSFRIANIEIQND